MAYEPDNPKLVYLPFDKLSYYTGIVMHLRNHWWSVHPERGLIFWSGEKHPSIERGSPQCNANEVTARSLRDKLYPWAELRYFMSVLYPIDPHDY